MEGKLPSSSRLEELDFGTVVTTATRKTVEVEVDPTEFFSQYGIALAKELQRRNPLKFQALSSQMSEDTMIDGMGFSAAMSYYASGLVRIRIQSVNGGCPNWRQAKTLSIPTVIQEMLARVGRYHDKLRGKVFVPTMKDVDNYDIKIMQRISDYIESFESDGFKLFKDAIPRGVDGDPDTMQVIIREDNRVYSFKEFSHPTATYVAAMLGLRINDPIEGGKFEVPYDDVDFILDQVVREVVRW